MGRLVQKIIRVIEFSGQKGDWRYWSRKFLAKGNLLGWKKLVIGDEICPTKAEYLSAKSVDTPDSVDCDSIRLYELNVLAYSNLLLSIDTKSDRGKNVFDLVTACQMVDFPDGNVNLAWQGLREKIEPQNAPSYIQLRRQFANSTLSANGDPDVRITQLEYL